MGEEYSRYPSIAQDGAQKYADHLAKRNELLDQIVQAVSDGNEYQALELSRQWNQLPLLGRLKDALLEWKFELIQNQALLMNALRKSGAADLLLDGLYTEYMQRISQAATVEACKLLFENMVQQFCSANQLRESYHFSMLVQKVILEVNLDLGQSLTLQHFSESLNVNDSYLSNLFRRETGVTLTDYVTERRMRQAASLLKSTQYPIKTIAKQVGITDVHYFSRIFKKRMGKPPSQYRLERENEQERVCCPPRRLRSDKSDLIV